MARSAVVDPLEKFRFLVTWSDTAGGDATPLVRLGFHDIQMPKRSTTKIQYREGIDPDITQVAAGLSSMEDVVMSRGVIGLDANNEFYNWISSVHGPTAGHVARADLGTASRATGANEYKKDITIQMLDREGNPVRQWVLYNAFPVNFVPASDLNAQEDGEKAMEQLTVAYEDFQELPIA